jgi:ABC-type multidrug transport system fused ATPase/permease subunit
MTTRELVALDAPAVITQDPTSVGGLWKQWNEVRKELPDIFRGLWVFAQLFWKPLSIISAFNVVIAVLAVCQTLILALVVDTFATNVHYLEMAVVVVYPVLAFKIPHGMLLPFVRDLYTVWYVSPFFKKHISMKVFERSRNVDLPAKGPALQEGREVAWDLVQFCTREPVFVVKGLVIATILLAWSPVLMAIVIAGIAIDLLIALKMRKHITIPVSKMTTNGQEVKDLENRWLDSGGDISQSYYSEKWDQYIRSVRRAELPSRLFQLWRDGMSHLFQVAILLLAAWWVHTDLITTGTYFFLTQLTRDANDPLEILLGLIGKIIGVREQLRRLGLLLGMDLGLPPPEKTV